MVKHKTPCGVERKNIFYRGARLLYHDPRALMRGLCRRSYRLLTDIPGDLLLGISTGLWKKNDGDVTRQIHAYEPVPYPTLRDIRRHSQSNGINVPNFVDVGCGHGRPLYFFAREFDQLVGYEIDPEVYSAANEQLRRARRRRPEFKKIRILEHDATGALPIDGDMVIFMYNPFGPDSMTQFCHTLAKRNGETHIYYVNPLYADVVDRCLAIEGYEFSKFLKVKYYKMNAVG
jgi:SAM-dependent methyltransferase